MKSFCLKHIFVSTALLAAMLVACHREEQAVVGVAKKAETVEQKVQATQTQLDRERAQLDAIPLPTKSLYIGIHDPASWVNPILWVGPQTITLRTRVPNANAYATGRGTSSSVRRLESELHPADLNESLVAIPASAWPYGRVIAVAEAPVAAKDRPAVLRNVETVLKKLNDLGVVVEEWPSR